MRFSLKRLESESFILADYQRKVFPTMALAKFLLTISGAYWRTVQEIHLLHEKGYNFMSVLLASSFVTSLYDLLLKILGSELFRVTLSFLIRQALLRIGL